MGAAVPVLVDAIVVGSSDVGEASRVVRLLTAELGRVAVWVRGARASRKRHLGLLDPGTRATVSTRRGRGDLLDAANVDVRTVPRRARGELERLALLAYGCELCAALAPEADAAPRLHGLLSAWLDLLEGERCPNASQRIALEAKALTFAGFAPMLLRCARCAGDLEEPVVFDPLAGGVVHEHCGGGRRVTLCDAASVEALRKMPAREAGALGLPSTFRWVLSDFVQHQLGHALKSRTLLEQIPDV